MIDLTRKQETVILAAVSLYGNDESALRSLSELEQLVRTAGAAVLGKTVQKREAVDPATYVGSGKLTEIRQMMDETGADGLVCDDELTPAQISSLSQALGCKVMDRTMVILDIFARRASSAEGKVQVELAQQRYRLSHLAGLGVSLSRLGVGIGTRGPGEKKLETDRRHIRSRISQLKRELEEIVQHRSVTRAGRQRSASSRIAIVGYTNAGKSTLLNRLTDAGVLEEDELFATLDPTTRQFITPGGQKILLTDTVGFISKLPHNLIDAFRSTLEEARYADHIIHVLDASSPDIDEHIRVVYDTLYELGIRDKKILTIFNKMDLAGEDVRLTDPCADYTAAASLKTGSGLDEICRQIEIMVRSTRKYISRVFPYSQAGLVQRIRLYGELISESYEEDGIHIAAFVPEGYDRL